MEFTSRRNLHGRFYGLTHGGHSLAGCTTTRRILGGVVQQPDMLIWSNAWGTPIARITDRIAVARILKRWRAAEADSVLPYGC